MMSSSDDDDNENVRSDYDDAYESDPEVTAEDADYRDAMLDFVSWWWTQQPTTREEKPSREELLKAHSALCAAVSSHRDEDDDDDEGDGESLPYDDNIVPESLDKFMRAFEEGDLTAVLCSEAEGTPHEAAQRWLLRVTPALKPSCVRQKNGRCLRGRIKSVERYRGDEDEVVAAWLKHEGITEEDLAEIDNDDDDEQHEEEEQHSDSDWQQSSTEDYDDDEEEEEDDFDDDIVAPPKRKRPRHASALARAPEEIVAA